MNRKGRKSQMMPHKRKMYIPTKDSPFYLHLKNGHQLILLLVVFLLLEGVVGSAMVLGSNLINNEKNAVFDAKWQYSVNNSPYIEVSLPNSQNVSESSPVTLKNHLPTEMVKGATLLLRTSQQNVEVAVDSEVIYSSTDRKKHIASPSSAYHFVRLPTDCAGDVIEVALSSPFSNYAGFMSQIYIGSKASNLFFLIHENSLRFIIGFSVFSIGCLLMLMFLFAKGQEGKASITHLGAFFVCAGYWVLVESRMMQFIFPYPVALTNSSIFALSLLPVFSGLYYYNTSTKVYKKISKGVLAVVTAISFAFAVMASVNPLLPIRILPFYLVFLILYLFLLFASIFLESIKAGKFFSTSVCGIFTFSVCALLELVFYLSNMKAYNQSNFLTVGLLLFCVFMAVDSAQNFASVYHAAVKVDTLSVLAYTDSLTGLGNRTAFLEEMSIIEANGRPGVTIAMYDVNNLKVVNDTKGHLVGDALLRHCTKAIKASLRAEDKVYRIGGDEFVAILRHGEDFDSSALEERLLLVLEKENQKMLSYTLSIAYGFATYVKNVDQTLFETQARADKSMYACKKGQKAFASKASDA